MDEMKKPKTMDDLTKDFDKEKFGEPDKKAFDKNVKKVTKPRVPKRTQK